MMSNSSFFDLLRENFKRRYWSAALSLLLFFFIYPVTTLLMAGEALSENSLGYLETFYSHEIALRIARSQLLDQWENHVAAKNGLIVGFMLLLAMAVTFSGFRYLHVKQQTDFYHSLPVSRTRLFLAVNLNSFLIAAVPCFLMSFISGVIVQVSTGAGSCVPYVLAQSWLLLFFYLLFSMTALLAVLLTGNLTVGILGFSVFLYLGPTVVGVLYWMRNSFFRTAWSDPAFYDRIQQYTSPFSLGMDLSDATAVHRALVALAAAAVLFFLNRFLYRKRPSEAAEKAMAFPVTEAPIKCVIAVTMGLVGAMMFFEIQGSFGWSLFGLVCGVVLTHCLMEIIYRFDFRNLFARKGQLALCLVLALGIFSVFRFDLLGYDRWIPAENQVKGAALFTDTLESNIRFYNNKVVLGGGEGFHSVGQESARSMEEMLTQMDLVDPSVARTAAEHGIASLHREDQFAHPGAVTVAWHLNSGRTVIRTYFMNLSDIREELDQVCADPGFRAAVYPVLTALPEEIVGVNYYDASGPDNMPGTAVPLKAADAAGFRAPATREGSGGAGIPVNTDNAAEVAKILAAYQKEFGTLTAETRRKEAPIACLQFKDQYFQGAADILRKEHPDNFRDYVGTFNDIGWYPVYPSFRETIAALADCGVTLNAALAPEKVAALEIRDITPAPSGITAEEERSESWRKPAMLVTDEAQIREFLSCAMSRELPYMEPMTISWDAVNVYVLMGRDKALTPAETNGDPEWSRETQLFNFQGEKVPAAVREHFGPADEDEFRQHVQIAY